MKLNKKGITLIEIIISIVLISIVLIFLFTMLIAVNDMNSESEMDSTYLINKSLFVKNVEEDLKYADHTKPINIYGCNIKDFFTTYESSNDDKGANECIKIGYIDVNGDTKTAYIGIFYLESQKDYVLSYVNGSSKSTRKLPEFANNNLNNSNEIKNKIYAQYYNSQEFSSNILCKEEESSCVSYFGGSIDRIALVKIPLIGSDGKDYSILISYIGKIHIYTN